MSQSKLKKIHVAGSKRGKITSGFGSIFTSDWMKRSVSSFLSQSLIVIYAKQQQMPKNCYFTKVKTVRQIAIYYDFLTRTILYLNIRNKLPGFFYFFSQFFVRSFPLVNDRVREALGDTFYEEFMVSSFYLKLLLSRLSIYSVKRQIIPFNFYILFWPKKELPLN